jgi:hypothetical protein
MRAYIWNAAPPVPYDLKRRVRDSGAADRADVWGGRKAGDVLMAQQGAPDPHGGIAGYSARMNAGSAFFGAAIMLFFGFFWLRDVRGVAVDAPVYNGSVLVVVRTFQIGGLALLAVAGLCMAGWRYGLVADALTEALIGTTFLVTGGIWLGHSDNMGALLMLFACMGFYSAWGSWTSYRLARRSGTIVPSHFSDLPPTSPHDAPPRPPDEETYQRLRKVKSREPQRADPGSGRAGGSAPRVDVTPEESPPEGFLADLGRNPDTQDEEKS